MATEPKPSVSRRAVLRGVGIAGAAVSLTPADLLVSGVEASQASAPPRSEAPTSTRRDALEVLTAAEAVTLEAAVARIIPTDDQGPGAAEAHAAHYIDRALNGPLAMARPAYQAGLAALDRYAQGTKGGSFATLKAADQDAVLTDLEKDVATGFIPSASAFFEMLRTHTIQGMFSDPYYGGNANFVGWELIGYPGMRMPATAQDQAIDSPSKPVRRSAYDGGH
jgi:gluconate 2-dehydrogenase gamma chain